MIKITALYGHPVDATAFEAYYFSTNMPFVAKIRGVIKAETTKFLPGPDGANPPYCRIAELYFLSPEIIKNALSSAEVKATTDDLGNFSSGGVTILIGAID